MEAKQNSHSNSNSFLSLHPSKSSSCSTMLQVKSQLVFEHFAHPRCNECTTEFTGTPVIDLTDPQAKSQIVQACEEFGFFKVVNHGVSDDLIVLLETQAMNFFQLPQSEKDNAGPPDPFGYGSKRIGPNGDIGWIEYLLLNTNNQLLSENSILIFKENPEVFRCAVEDYILAMKNMACGLLEMMAEGLGIEKSALSKLLKDEESDCCFRLNHYPPCPELETMNGTNLIGFGEHTDPQIISVLRSNNTSGLQICLKDGSWVSIPPDESSFFINVGDSLQVMTNGRFESVKHKVLADPVKYRFSMIYFGGPALNVKIAPLPSILEEGEKSLYKEFTWWDYKNSAYKSRLGDCRLSPFEIKNLTPLLT